MTKKKIEGKKRKNDDREKTGTIKKKGKKVVREKKILSRNVGK